MGDSIEIPVIRAQQNDWNLYVGVMAARDLYEIHGVDRLRLERLEIPKYAGYQRALVPDRVEDIQGYLKRSDSTFPNAIIVSIDSEYIEDWRDDGTGKGTSVLVVKREKGAARIIDGQHRAAALKSASEEFQVIVSLFVDLEMQKCAQIFARINSTQKTVNPSIAFQLFGYAEGRSPQRTAHEIAVAFNTRKGSPFYHRLMMLGTKEGWQHGILSQSTFCKGVMSLFTKDAAEDEHRLVSGDPLDEYGRYPMRKWFIDGDDGKILSTLWWFFYHIAQAWPNQWRDPEKKSILAKSMGYSAWIDVLRVWLLGPRRDEVLMPEAQGVKEALETIKTGYEFDQKCFTTENYGAGNAGKIKLRNTLLSDLELSRTP